MTAPDTGLYQSLVFTTRVQPEMADSRPPLLLRLP